MRQGGVGHAGGSDTDVLVDHLILERRGRNREPLGSVAVPVETAPVNPAIRQAGGDRLALAK